MSREIRFYEKRLQAALDRKAESIVDATLKTLRRLYPGRKFGVMEGHGEHSFMVWDKSGKWTGLRWVSYCDRMTRGQRIAEKAEGRLADLEITIKGFAKDQIN